MGMTLLELADQLRDEADAYKFLEELRWPDGEPICPHCEVKAQHYFLNPANGSTRATRTGSASQRRVWKCRSCRKQFSVLTGTIFHGTKIPLRKWVLVVFEMASIEERCCGPRDRAQIRPHPEIGVVHDAPHP